MKRELVHSPAAGRLDSRADGRLDGRLDSRADSRVYSPANGQAQRVLAQREAFPANLEVGNGQIWPIFHSTEVDSTNLEALRLIDSGHHKPLIVVADSQSAGRCRHKIIWESPSNLGLWLSFVWFSKVTWAQMPQSTLVLAVAVKEAIKEACDLDLGIKWPNDLLGGGKKCAGLLVETAPKSPQKALVLGIGINLSQRCRDFPISLRDTATSLGMLSGNFNLSRTKLTFSLAYRIKYWFEKWELEGFTEVRRAWLKDNLTLGREIVVDNGLPLLAIDLDQSGALVAKTTNDQIVTFNTGEIRFV